MALVACQCAIASLSSSSSAALPLSAVRSTCSSCSSSMMASLLLPPSFQGLRSRRCLSRGRLLHSTPCMRACSSSSSSSRPLLVTVVVFGTSILYKTADGVWEIHGHSTLEQSRSNAKISASLDSDAGKAEGARKALEQAFQGKNTIAKKWEEDIKKRELSGGDGGGGSGGGSGGGDGSWGGGGGDEEMGESFGQDEPWDWEEAGQTFMATFALLILYISITQGPKQVLKKFKLLFRYIRQGFRLRKIPDEYLYPEGSEEDLDEDETDSDDDDDNNAQDEFSHHRRAEDSNAQEGFVQKNDSVNDETEEDDEDDDVLTPSKQQAKREDLLSKRQAEQKEKLLKLLTPKELRQQEEQK